MWSMSVYSRMWVYVPIELVLLLEGVLLGLLLKAYWRRWIEMGFLLLLWTGQTAVLLAWGAKITSADARAHNRWRLVSGWNPEGLVLDSRVEAVAMGTFWIASVLVLGGLLAVAVVEIILRIRKKRSAKGLVWRILAILLAGFILFRMSADTHELIRMHVCLAESTSPDGKRDIRLVPRGAYIHVNGMVLCRQSGSLWWTALGTAGSRLWREWNSARFAWEGDTRVKLLLNEDVIGDYDLATGQDMLELNNLKRRRATDTTTGTMPVVQPPLAPPPASTSPGEGPAP